MKPVPQKWEGALLAADVSENELTGCTLRSAVGWKDAGELRLRMERAPSMSSHERDMVTVSIVKVSSSSMAEEVIMPWADIRLMAMGVEVASVG